MEGVGAWDRVDVGGTKIVRGQGTVGLLVLEIFHKEGRSLRWQSLKVLLLLFFPIRRHSFPDYSEIQPEFQRSLCATSGGRLRLFVPPVHRCNGSGYRLLIPILLHHVMRWHEERFIFLKFTNLINIDLLKLLLGWGRIQIVTTIVLC